MGIGCCLRMNLVYSLALVLPAFVLHPGVWGSSTDNPALSSCDPDLLPCTDNGDNICDCPSEEQSRARKDRNRRSGALKGQMTVSCPQCKFPFTYRGIKYRECTTVDNGGIPWCATTTHSNGDSNLWKNCDAGILCTIRQDVLDELNKLRRGIHNKGLRMLIRDAALEERAEELASILPCNFFDQGGILPDQVGGMLILPDQGGIFDVTMNWGEVMTGAPGVKMVWNSIVEIMSQRYSRIGIGITSNCQRFLPQGVHARKVVALVD